MPVYKLRDIAYVDVVGVLRFRLPSNAHPLLEILVVLFDDDSQQTSRATSKCTLQTTVCTNLSSQEE